MKETIATIPINDIFAENDGCPICRMTALLEKNAVEYITGPAMMVPEVRVETNKKGFCHRHLSQMISCGKRLSNALTLETHLQELAETCIPADKDGKIDKKRLKQLSEVNRSCFVCDRIELEAAHLYDTVCSHWSEDAEFRKLYANQKYICLKHYYKLITFAQENMKKKFLPDFCKATSELTFGYVKELKGDLAHFCSMFDYRSKGEDFGNSKDSIERALTFLTGCDLP